MTLLTTRTAVLIALLMASPVRAEVYKCVDEKGGVTYTNAVLSSQSRCALLNPGQPVATVPGRAPSSTAPSPAHFPKVDEQTQKTRENDRRKILEQELDAERKSLEQAEKELAGHDARQTPERLQSCKDRVALHERNIRALNKEIAHLK